MGTNSFSPACSIVNWPVIAVPALKQCIVSVVSASWGMHMKASRRLQAKPMIDVETERFWFDAMLNATEHYWK